MTLLILEQIILFLVLYIPLLLTVAFFVVSERKMLASVQRRVGPKIVGL
jgi:NADH:ubiquinone oxidoreductase subunit H